MQSIITLILLIIIPFVQIKMDDKLSLDGKWLFKSDPEQLGIENGYFKTNFNRNDWEEVDLPGYWDDHSGLVNYDGWGWYHKEFVIDHISKDLMIYFSGIDDDARIWVNGEEIGEHSGYNEPFFFDISKKIKTGKNSITIQVIDYSGPGGIYKPVFIVEAKEVDKYIKSKISNLNARQSSKWVKEAIIYSVYLRSFSKEGTFKALEKRIPELKELGVTVIWLLPIHPVGKLHRKGTLGSPYSVKDYYAVNPEFGTLQDFRDLVHVIHKNDMKVIIDLVANHTSWDSELIKYHPEWFTKDLKGNIIPPNNDWTDVADLDYSNRELWRYMIDMMKWWVKEIDIDGFRCDVSELVPLEFWEQAREELDKIKSVMMLSEGSLPEHHLKAFDLTYSWNVYDKFEHLLKGKARADVLTQILRNEELTFPKGSLRMRFNTNHDKNAWDKPAILKFGIDGLKLSAVLINTIPGVPLLYNGEEVANSRRLDLFEKVEIDWNTSSEMYQLYETLFALRKKYKSLVDGGFEPLEIINTQSVYAFIRSNDNEKLLIILNFSKEKVKAKIRFKDRFNAMQDLINYTKHKVTLSDNEVLEINLKPFDYSIYRLE